jgi:hypothetical protein
VDMPQVAAAALKHLDHQECEVACYRCLKSYSNQRYHDLLNWQCVTGVLEGLVANTSKDILLSANDRSDTDAWQEAFAAGCGSPLELKALKVIESLGLDPAKQYTITAPDTDRPFTIPDFAFVDEKVAIYIDGVVYHRGDRLRRDKAIDERLKMLGWHVLRFTAQDIHRGTLAQEVRLVQFRK